ncbi:MAG: OpgC protein [Candidatus Tokpelaia sp. JSC188]|nr:MAG: OpgC protein [Candidatus Tokpelaia sp. JSC188]
MHFDRQLNSKRDTRIDVFRALALLTIFINHVPGTIFEHITHKHFGFSDSAEVFVLISGISVGFAYGTRYHIGRRLLLTLKIWRRTFILYFAHILMTLMTLGIFCGAAIFMHHPECLLEINIAPVVTEPAKALFGIVTLGHQLGYNNILPLYIVLMFIAPLMLYIAGKNLGLLLILSGILYFIAGIYQIAPPNYPTKGLWFLNPLSWQFLFVIGFAAVIYTKKGGTLPRHPLLLITAAAYLTLSLIWVRWNFWGIDISMGLPQTLIGFNKTFISLPRLLHILSLAYVISVIPAISNWMQFGAYHPLAILGKYSLPVFITGTVLAMIAQILKKINPGGIPYDILLISSGIIVQFTVAYYLEWLSLINLRCKDIPVISNDMMIPVVLNSINTELDSAKIEKKTLESGYIV